MHASTEKIVRTLCIIMALSQSTVYSFYPLSLRDIIAENKPLVYFLSATALMYAKSYSAQRIQDQKQKTQRQIFKDPHVWAEIIQQKELAERNALTNGFIADCKRDHAQNSLIPKHTQNTSTLRVATWNVFLWNHVGDDSRTHCSVDQILKDIKVICPDVLMLQEVKVMQKLTLNQLQEKLSNLGYHYYVMQDPKATESSPEFQWGNAIFSKYPLDNEENNTFSHNGKKTLEDRGHQKVTVNLPGYNTLDIINTHLDVFNAYVNKDNEEMTENMRISEAQELLTVCEGNHNVIIAGDFNSIRTKDFETDNQKKFLGTLRKNYKNIPHCKNLEFPETDALDIFDEGGFISAFEHLKWQEPKYTTWTATNVDKILVPKDFEHEITGAYAYCPEDPKSDHVPVIADIKIRNGALIKRFFTLVRYYRFSNILRKWIND